MLVVVVFLFLGIALGMTYFPEMNQKKKETSRLENIVIEVQTALENEEYKHALRLADSIVYEEENDALETEWAVKRDYWIDKVIEEAAENGVTLQQ